ncbi:hypothetical protein [Vreelandella titanicae]|uniref:hypothetical protein n=1 Tax=Vreelandella titanicae TaxID=664683 RepID=UPI0037F36B61
MKLLAVAALALVLAGCGESESYDEKMARTCGTPAQAYQYSKAAVKSHLKSPSSANFPGSVMDDAVEYEEVNRCTTTIRAHVDSQNTYGAEVRSQYQVTISYDVFKDSWSYSDLSIE